MASTEDQAGDRTALSRAQGDVLEEVAAERRRQDEKWGEQNHPDGTGDVWEFCSGQHAGWAQEAADDARRRCQEAPDRAWGDTYALILNEEVAEAFAETDPAALRRELIQVAAVAVAWVEAIDRRAAVAAPRCTRCGEHPGEQWLPSDEWRASRMCGRCLLGNTQRVDATVAPGQEFQRIEDAAPTPNIADLIERSSLGTPEAKRLRESVPPEVARRVVERAEALGATEAAPTGEAQGGGDEPCDDEIHSWSYFRPEQVDSYWIRCDKRGPHDEHEDEETGATWAVSLPEGGEQHG